MTATKHIKGTLSISNRKKMDGRIHDAILKAAVNNGISLIIKEVSKNGVIEIDSYSTAFGGRNAAIDFIGRLLSVLNEESVAGLEISGKLMMTVLSEAEPVVFRITVERGAVTVEEATLTWEQK